LVGVLRTARHAPLLGLLDALGFGEEVEPVNLIEVLGVHIRATHVTEHNRQVRDTLAVPPAAVGRWTGTRAKQ
jgi:hypothetical protein